MHHNTTRYTWVELVKRVAMLDERLKLVHVHGGAYILSKRGNPILDVTSLLEPHELEAKSNETRLHGKQ